MNEKLQQAITAARSGQSTEAQILLTQVLKENPEETQAWFLLSNLVDSEQKKLTYLGKVLALDPQHKMAKQMLARLQEGSDELDLDSAVVATSADVSGETVVQEFDSELEKTRISTDPLDYLSQEKGDTVPDWLAEEEGLPWEEPIVAETEPGAMLASPEERVVPDWLQEEVIPPWSDEEAGETETMVELATESDTLPAQAEPEARPEDSQPPRPKSLTRLLYTLILVAAIIFVILIYLIWTGF